MLAKKGVRPTSHDEPQPANQAQPWEDGGKISIRGKHNNTFTIARERTLPGKGILEADMRRKQCFYAGIYC